MAQDEKKLIIGSRESLLAVRQSELVLDYLREHFPQMQIELVTMKTTGDKILHKRLDEIGGKGLFVKELDQALRDGRTDLSVHSLKDLPAEIPEDLPVIGFSGREDPRDVLVLPEGIADISEMDFSKPIGTSSRRRTLQAQELFPQARFESVRGNVLTRLRKLDEGQYSAIILAAAGLRRLGGNTCPAGQKRSGLLLPGRICQRAVCHCGCSRARLCQRPRRRMHVSYFRPRRVRRGGGRQAG